MELLDVNDSVRINDIQFTSNKNGLFHGSVHLVEGCIIIELEPVLSELDTPFNLFQTFNKYLSKLKNAHSVLELCHKTADVVRSISGFDRVMIYRFNEQWHGEVVAESRVEHVDSYLGLHYPASDIPQNARELYRINSFRLVHYVDDEPCKLVPEINPLTRQPLNMSRCFLRGVSPVHIEYLKNMEVTASMSMPIIRDNVLWGLVACQHHAGAMPISFEKRMVCGSLAQLMSIQLEAKEDSENYQYRVHLQSLQSRFMEKLALKGDFLGANTVLDSSILDLVNASGAALCMNGKIQQIGDTFSVPETKELVIWLQGQIQSDLFSTNSLLDSGYSGSGASGISGLLAITLSNDKRNMLLWFRNELVHSLNWAGNPNKLVEYDQEGRSFLHPRKSFEAWKEIVHGHCEPWKSPEILAALDIRSSLISIILKKADELAVLNEELENRNIELDSFAHIASHDLKEPLRGIHNYSQILLEENASKLDEASISRLETLVSLTQRMERIINSLLKYSQQDREEIEPLKVNFLTVLEQVIERLKITIDQEEIVINTASDIPWALCDQSGLAEVLSNLVVNAIKYNTKHPKIIEIGFKPSLEENLNLYYVKDNGIGIPNDQLNVVFKMFKRLHPRNDFGGGTGAGLAIAKKIIERNGGRLWVESTPGEGSTFFFTLKAIRGN